MCSAIGDASSCVKHLLKAWQVSHGSDKKLPVAGTQQRANLMVKAPLSLPKQMASFKGCRNTSPGGPKPQSWEEHVRLGLREQKPQPQLWEAKAQPRLLVLLVARRDVL